MRKFAWLLFGAIAGVVVGVVAAFVRADRIRISGTMVPYGIVLALLGVVVAQLWLARRFQSRLISIGFAVGWVAITIVLGAANGTDDLVIPSSGTSAAYVLIGAILVSMCAAIPPLRLNAAAQARHLDSGVETPMQVEPDGSAPHLSQPE